MAHHRRMIQGGLIKRSVYKGMEQEKRRPQGRAETTSAGRRKRDGGCSRPRAMLRRQAGRLTIPASPSFLVSCWRFPWHNPLEAENKRALFFFKGALALFFFIVLGLLYFFLLYWVFIVL